MGLNAVNNDSRVALIKLFTCITTQDSIIAFQIMLIGSESQWDHRYLKGLLAGFWLFL